MDERAQLLEAVLTHAVGLPVQVGAERWVLYRYEGWWCARHSEDRELWRVASAGYEMGVALDRLATEVAPERRRRAEVDDDAG